MSSVVRLGNAILGEWRSAAKRPAMPVNERRVRQRRNSLSRLSFVRRSQDLAIGDTTAWALVCANIIAGFGNAVTGPAISKMMGSFGVTALDAGAADAVAADAETARRLWGAGRHALMTPRMVGSLLQVTAAEREEAVLLDVDAIDEAPADRRRRLDRERKKAARAARAAKAGPRLTQAELAAKAGVSLATWKRRQSAEPKSVRSPSIGKKRGRAKHARA